MESRKMTPMCRTALGTQTQRTDLVTQWEEKWEGWIERVTLKHIHYHS